MKVWGIMMLCITLTVTKTQSAAVSTTETLIVAKTGDEVSQMPSSSDVTTEEPNSPIKLTEMVVRSEVTLRYAHTAVVTHVRNPASKAQEATFHVLLPDTAFISGFVMTLDGKSYKAYVKEKNEAKKIFHEAVSQGSGAAHIAAKARDSNHFTVSVNVEPKSVAIFNLTYEELLVRRNGVYNHAINLHPGTLVPKLEVVVHIKESQKITTLRVPEVRTGNEIDATDNDTHNSKAVQLRIGDKEVTITFAPDLEEQIRLIKIYKDKTKDSAFQRSSQNKEGQRDGALGQFVVQYDVERSNNGEILINDGYFVHFLAPSTLPALSKHVVFVLDTSSSMMGRKVEQLKAAMDAIISELNPNDYFNIVEFNSDFAVHQLKEAEEPVIKYSWYSPRINKELVSPALASPENIAKAKVIISRLLANGGTNIYSALNVAIDLIHMFAGNKNKQTSSLNTEEDTAVKNSNNVKYQITNELEPIIIFLTDGEPTMGEISTTRIISLVTEKNSREMKASLYALAFGEDADRNFLRKLSLRNEGFMRHIYEASDADLQLRDFYRQVSSPLLAHVNFTYPKEQIKEGSVSKHEFRTVYSGSEVVVAGELSDEASELAPVVRAVCGAMDGARISYEDHPKINITRVTEDYFPLERLWAYLTIKQLLDERETADQSVADEIEKKALALALKYSFVTSLTSLVVIKPNETNAVDAESVDKDDQSSGIQPSYQTNGYRRVINSIGSDPGISLHIIGNLDEPNKDYRSSRGGSQVITNMSNGEQNSNTIHFGRRGNRARSRKPATAAPRAQIIPNWGNGGYHSNMVTFDNQGNMITLHDSDARISGGYGSARHRYHNYGYSSDEDNSNDDGDNDYNGWGNYDTWARPHFRNHYTPTYKIPSVPSTTPLIFTTEVPDEKKYHLENYSWALGLLNNSGDALTFWENETQILLELSKDANAPRSSGPEEACSNTPASSPGPATCVYLTRCAAARNITVEDYRKSYCRVDNKYAGVCCPSSQVDTTVA